MPCSVDTEVHRLLYHNAHGVTELEKVLVFDLHIGFLKCSLAIFVQHSEEVSQFIDNFSSVRILKAEFWQELIAKI